VTFTGTPATRQLSANIVPTIAGGPIFQYWQFISTAGPTLGAIDPTPVASGGSLAPTDLNNIVRVTVAFTSQPERTKTQDARSTSLEGSGTVGSADPTEPQKGANC
jgi:hypothetical protein